jgi:hypothetical protein
MEEETRSNSSLDSVELVARNKRKRIQEDEEEGKKIMKIETWYCLPPLISYR